MAMPVAIKDSSEVNNPHVTTVVTAVKAEAPHSACGDTNMLHELG